MVDLTPEECKTLLAIIDAVNIPGKAAKQVAAIQAKLEAIVTTRIHAEDTQRPQAGSTLPT